jgi:hypothetical protein
VSFDVAGASAAENAINGNIGLSLGFTWGQSQTHSYTATCETTTRASVWARQGLGYANIEQRYINGACFASETKTEWTKSRVTYILKESAGGLKAYETGCSSGDKADCGQGISETGPPPPDL